MRILILHNFYQVPGGEDSVVASEVALLKSRGHEIIEDYVYNDSIRGVWRKLTTLLGMMFSPRQYARIRRLLRSTQADVIHLHNFFPLLSPSVVYAANREKTPIVMTMHNFRTICPTVVLMHEGVITKKSVESGPWWALKHRVYHNSYTGTFGLILMIWLHKKLGTWQRVNKLVTLTEFARKTFIESGIAHPARITVKPNFIDYLPSAPPPPREPFILYVGRMSPEKGTDVFLEASKQLKHRCVIATPKRESTSETLDNVEYREALTREQVLDLMSRAICLVVPSTCYEGFPMVIVEAFATGTPVICSKLGGLIEIIEDGKSGLHFPAGDINSLAEKINFLMANPGAAEAMGNAAADNYQAHYRSKQNAEALESIYREAQDT